VVRIGHEVEAADEGAVLAGSEVSRRRQSETRNGGRADLTWKTGK
jgi:hypothetical protein